MVRDYTFSQQVAQHPCHMPTHPGDISLHREERLVPPHHKDPKNTSASFTVSKTTVEWAQKVKGARHFDLNKHIRTWWSSSFLSFQWIKYSLAPCCLQFAHLALYGSVALQLCKHRGGIHFVFRFSCSRAYYKDCHRAVFEFPVSCPCKDACGNSGKENNYAMTQQQQQQIIIPRHSCRYKILHY